MADYADTDFLYFDTEKRAVIGPVEWTKTGNVKPLEKPSAVPESGERTFRRKPRKEYYIWGTYRSLKHLYNLEGKSKREESTQTLESAMTRSMQEPYWDAEIKPQ